MVVLVFNSFSGFTWKPRCVVVVDVVIVTVGEVEDVSVEFHTWPAIPQSKVHRAVVLSEITFAVLGKRPLTEIAHPQAAKPTVLIVES